MKVTHDTKFEDANISYTTLTIVIDVCVITRVDPPPAPSSPVTYTIHALNDVIVDLSSPGFVQQPACGYTLTEKFTWSYSPTPAVPMITTTASPYVLTIKSKTNSHANVYTATLTN